ncbi:MAG: hypothetical protein QG671_363 [Actinomycetota bacterium]|jgi:hypothetical protein|nr:hypothetical protein [Actinomycetota bacterium]
MESAPPELGLPSVTVLYAGDPASQVAAALLATVSGTAAPLPVPVANDSVLELAQPHDRSRAAPVLVIASADAAETDLIAGLMATADAAARDRARVRIWLALLPPVAPVRLAELDSDLEQAGRPLLDSVVLLGPATAAASASSLAAWLHLRHDAPSSAFADLRDMDGYACRYASVAAVAVASPPGPTDVNVARAIGDQAGVNVQATIATMYQKLAEDGAGTAADGDTAVADARTAILAALIDADAASLESAGIALAAATEVADPAPQLREAELRRARAESLLAAETARSGLGAKFGRKRRLAPLTEELSLADEGLRQARLVDRQYSAAIGLRDGLTSELADRATAVARSAEVAAAESHAAAVSAWFERALAEATRVQVPVGVRTEAMSRGWGDAAPAVRRYLLVPQDMQLGTTTLGVAAGDPDGLVVVATPGLDRPLAAAILLGLTQPATEFS